MRTTVGRPLDSAVSSGMVLAASSASPMLPPPNCHHNRIQLNISYITLMSITLMRTGRAVVVHEVKGLCTRRGKAENRHVLSI
jgi:hypothetical protein